MLILNSDGGCFPNPGRGTWAMIARPQTGGAYRRSGAIPRATNNIAEWQGALEALDFAIGYTMAYPERTVELRMDSQLVVHQLTGRWRTKNAGLLPLMVEGRRRVQALRDQGVTFRVQWVPREQNTEADALT